MELRSRDGVLPVILALCVGLVSACDKPQVGSAGTPITAGGVEFSVGDYDVRYLEISEGEQTFEYPRPVLILPITVKNVGEGSLVYSPNHSSQQMTETTTPLLYLDPGADATLPPESKSLINGVVLEKGTPVGQAGSTTLEKGQSVDDILLFEVPDQALDLVLSLPPAMHRDKLPVLFKWRFEPKEPAGPKVYAVGQSLEFNGVTFTLDGGELTYVKTNDSAQGEGFSTEALYKVDYTIKNDSEATIRYEPGHKAVGTRGAALFTATDALKKVRFPGTTSVEGQLDRSTVDPGQEIKDFVLFEAPSSDVKTLSFEFPASVFGASGLARYELPFEFKEVPKPAELTKKE